MNNEKQRLFLPGYMLDQAENYEAAQLVDDLIPVYQQAFSGEPWREVSKCPVPQTTGLEVCAGGFSSTSVGKLCESCDLCPDEPAYTAGELKSKFKAVAQKNSALYIERVDTNLTFAAIAYVATAQAIGAEKYNEATDMKSWLERTVPGDEIVWLDEAFANLKTSPNNNLSEFQYMINGFTGILNRNTVAYRTISPAMVKAARRFGEQSTVYSRQQSVPDRRDFILISTDKETQ